MDYQCNHNSWTTIICSKCSRKSKILTDARELSSGTIAGLIDNSNYDAIDKARQDFVAWLTKTDQVFKNWRVAWDAFDIRQYKLRCLACGWQGQLDDLLMEEETVSGFVSCPKCRDSQTFDVVSEERE